MCVWVYVGMVCGRVCGSRSFTCGLVELCVYVALFSVAIVASDDMR